MDTNELKSLTVAELKALARKKKIAVPARAKKTDIIRVLVKEGAAPAKKPAKAPAKGRGKQAAAGPAAKAPQKTKRKAPPKEAIKGRAAPEARPAGGDAPASRSGETMPPREREQPAGAERPLMAQERVSDAKYFTGAPEHRPAMPYDSLPREYGEERMALMARDPYTAFSFWEVPQARLEKEKAWFGWDSKLCIRVYDVTGVAWDGTNASAYFDQEVHDRVGAWYLEIDRPAHSFCADLGLLAPNGKFLTLLRSDVVTLPRDRVSDVLDEEWMLLDEEFMKLYGAPGKAAGGPSSLEVQELMRQRRIMGITSPGLFPKQKAKKK